MNGFEWTYFVFGVIAYQILKLLALAVHHEVAERRRRRFLKLVHVTFPDKETITFIAVDASDRRSMTKIENQLREQFDLSEEETFFDEEDDRPQGTDRRRDR